MMGYINGVNLLPSTGEFTYDTIPYLGQRVTETLLTSINRYANGGPLAGTGTVTDYSIAIDQLQAAFLRHRTLPPRHQHLPPNGEKCYPCVRNDLSPISQVGEREEL